MVETLTNFPFRKLKDNKFLTVGVLAFVEYQDALEFLFSLNKEARTFLQENIDIVNNEFINGGLITY